MMLPDTDLRGLLAGYDSATLAAWYADLNCFAWPPDFPIRKPFGYDGAPQRCQDGIVVDQYTVLRPLMYTLKCLTTAEDRSRAAWHRMGRSAEEWAVWWDSEGQEAWHVTRE